MHGDDKLIRAEAIVAPPLRRTFKEVMHHVEICAEVVVIVGSAGTGKTLLLQLLEEECAKDGLSVSRFYRGDLVSLELCQNCDLLLIDEADSIPDEVLHKIIGGRANVARSVVLAFAHVRDHLFFENEKTRIVALDRLSDDEVRGYIRLIYAQPDLFSPDALDFLARTTDGSPRILQQIASFAFFRARHDARSQVAIADVQDAVASRMITLPAERNPTVDTSSGDSAHLSVGGRSSSMAPVGVLGSLDSYWNKAVAFAVALLDHRLWLLAGPCIAVISSIAIATIGSRILHDHTPVVRLSGETNVAERGKSLEPGLRREQIAAQGEPMQLHIIANAPELSLTALIHDQGGPVLQPVTTPIGHAHVRHRIPVHLKRHGVVHESEISRGAYRSLKTNRAARLAARPPTLKAVSAISRRSRPANTVPASKSREEHSPNYSERPSQSSGFISTIAIITDRLESWFGPP
jgi:hypothetical protein